MRSRRGRLPRILPAAAILVALAILFGAALLPASGVAGAQPAKPTQTHKPHPSLSPSPAAARTAAWVVDENAKPGTSAWRIPSGTPKGVIGYADRVSVEAGDTLGLYVKTKAETFHVEAYRMGYYQGLGARLIWTSDETDRKRQPGATVEAVTNMVRAPWKRTLGVSIDSDWVPGTYLLKLVSSLGGQAYIPMIVRDDSSQAALVLQSQVTTWQAYNDWGDYSLYHGPDGGYLTRSRVVSFDRPYDGRGAAGMMIQLPFVVQVERLGLDVTYWTDVDLHEQPNLLLNHSSLVALDHDEYWSSGMRQAALSARSQGVNLAFFGANSIYRHIRFDASPLGANREVICYKSGSEDPLYGVDDAEVTANWRSGPMPRPESDILGAMYSCARAHTDLVVSDAGSWVFAGTGLNNGDHIPGLVDQEYDKVYPNAPTPSSIQILAHSPVDCKGTADAADMTYYTTHSNAGVFNASSQGYVKRLQCVPPVSGLTCDQRAVQIFINVLDAFAEGPAGVAHPSVPNLAQFGITLTNATDP